MICEIKELMSKTEKKRMKQAIKEYRKILKMLEEQAKKYNKILGYGRINEKNVKHFVETTCFGWKLEDITSDLFEKYMEMAQNIEYLEKITGTYGESEVKQ